MNDDSEFESDCFRGPVWVPDIPQPGSLEKAYLNLGKLPPDCGCGTPRGTPGGTTDLVGIAYQGDFLEGLFDPGEDLVTG